MKKGEDHTAANEPFGNMAGDECILNFLFAIRLHFQPTNNDEQ
jgi:hypothetical protein